jgi:hypothetical protein
MVIGVGDHYTQVTISIQVTWFYVGAFAYNKGCHRGLGAEISIPVVQPDCLLPSE